MTENELRLSPQALQTGLMQRWRAELASQFVGDVISFAEYVATRNAKGLRDQANSSPMDTEPMGDRLDWEPIGIKPCNEMSLRWR